MRPALKPFFFFFLLSQGLHPTRYIQADPPGAGRRGARGRAGRHRGRDWRWRFRNSRLWRYSIRSMFWCLILNYVFFFLFLLLPQNSWRLWQVKNNFPNCNKQYLPPFRSISRKKKTQASPRAFCSKILYFFPPSANNNNNNNLSNSNNCKKKKSKFRERDYGNISFFASTCGK